MLVVLWPHTYGTVTPEPDPGGGGGAGTGGGDRRRGPGPRSYPSIPKAGVKFRAKVTREKKLELKKAIKKAKKEVFNFPELEASPLVKQAQTFILDIEAQLQARIKQQKLQDEQFLLLWEAERQAQLEEDLRALASLLDQLEMQALAQAIQDLDLQIQREAAFREEEEALLLFMLIN